MMNTAVKIGSILALLFIAGNAESSSKHTCQNSVDEFCKKVTVETSVLPNCTAVYGAFPDINADTQKLIEAHIQASMQFMIEGNIFSQWNENRKGFQNYFNKLSDDAWDDAVALLQHMVIRGGKLSKSLQINKIDEPSNIGELASLTRTLETEKSLVQESLQLMKSNPTNCRIEKSSEPDVPEKLKCKWHGDGEFAHFLAGEVSAKLILRVKHLANHVNMLSQALASQDAVNRGVILHLYDTQILK